MGKDIALDDDGEVNTKSDMIYFKSENHDLFDSTGIEILVWQCVGEIFNELETYVRSHNDMAESKISKSLEDIPVIPFLRGKDDRTYSYKNENRLGFWAQPNLDLDNIKASVLLNKTIGLPEVLINTPVEVETSEKLKGCAGDVPEICQRCSGYVQEMCRRCARDVPEMYRRCARDVPEMYRRCAGYVQEMCPSSQPAPHRDNSTHYTHTTPDRTHSAASLFSIHYIHITPARRHSAAS
ncbi:unnamed protein product [Allacma fusca]|uniref:Uncharacterized protein n=1 Tax=Allacma fusca TaxID=39272 RepID=A0A8J2PJV5_9HEXA|nr:unnamed protein product [Allacma fusca]